MTLGPAALEDRILSGVDRRLQLAAARGEIDDFPLLRRVLLQVKLTEAADDEVVKVATEALAQLPPLVLADVLERSANRKVLGYFAGHSRDPAALETIVRNPGANGEVLRPLLPKLPESLHHLLGSRREIFDRDPELLRLLPGTARRHLDPEGEVEETEAVPEELQAEIDAAFDTDEDDDSLDYVSMRESQGRLSEGQIRSLPVSARLRLCRGASRMLRGIMVRDPNPSVAVAVLEFNTLSDAEVEAIAGNRNVAAEVLNEIVRDRRWPRKRPIALALAKNPKVPAGAAVRLLSTLSARELRSITLDSGVAAVVRGQAKQLYRIRTR